MNYHGRPTFARAFATLIWIILTLSATRGADDDLLKSRRVMSVTPSKLGSRITRGHLDDYPGSSFLLAEHGGARAGMVALSAIEHYQIDDRGAHLVEPPSSPLCACIGDAIRPHPAFRATDVKVAATEPPHYDVLLVYTPAALAAMGSVDALTAQADLAMADANDCYRNSGIPLHGEIVAIRPVDYAESGEIRTDLHRLAVPGDGFLDEVQSWRDEANADLVCMFTRRDSADGYRGYAEILTAMTPDAEVLGFSVVDVQAATIEHLFAHELGHNMGCDHDHENTTGLHLFNFSFGWRFTGSDHVLYRDVMAYAPGESIPYFANPDVSFQGTPTGVPNYADQARTIIASTPVFTNFRSTDGNALVSVHAAVTEASIDATGDKRARFVFERTGSVAQPLTINYAAGGSLVAGTNYKAVSGQIAFGANDHFAKLRVHPLPDGPPFGEGDISVALQPGNGYVPADSPDGATTSASATIDDRLPLVSLGAAKRKDAAAIKVSVQRLGPAESALKVGYQLGGNADFTNAADGNVSIPAGKNQAFFVVHLSDTATAPEGQQSLEISLKPRATYNLGAASTLDFTY